MANPGDIVSISRSDDIWVVAGTHPSPRGWPSDLRLVRPFRGGLLSHIVGSSGVQVILTPMIAAGINLRYDGEEVEVVAVRGGEVGIKRHTKRRLHGGGTLSWLGETWVPVHFLVAENLPQLMKDAAK